MNSLRTKYLLAGSLLSFALTGCNHFFGNDDQVKDPLVVRDQGLSCVRSVGADLKGFLAGDDRDPVLIVDCISSALRKFDENTHGANPDGWTRGELSSFFETYFKEESRVKIAASANRSGPVDEGSNVAPFDGDWVAQARRRAIVAELFRWKASLFGGGETTLSREELARIRGLLLKVRGPLGEWRGQGSYLSFGLAFSGQSGDIVRLERMVKSIRSIGEIVSTELSVNLTGRSNQRGREAMKLQTLAASLEQAGLEVLESPERQQLVQTIKSVVLSGDAQTIAGDEWAELVRQASELWVGALRLRYGIAQNVSVYDRDIEYVELTVRDITKAIGRMIDRHGGRIDNDEIRRLTVQLEANKLLPSIVQAKSVNNTLEAILGKLLAGNSLANQNELSRGLKAEHLARVNDVVHDWAEGQRLAVAIAGPTGYVTVKQAQIAMSQIVHEPSNAVSENATQQMSELILRGRPLVRDELGRLKILPTDQIDGYRRQDLENLNITRVLMSAAQRGYSHERARAGAMPQINESEIQELFMDLKAIGRDLGIIDVRSLQSGIRTFMESNIFLSVSDGNAFISLHEMVEWFETVMSAGRVADQVHQDLMLDEAGARCATSPVDVFGKMRLKAQCFRENVVPVLRRRMSHLPNFVRMLDAAEKQNKVSEFLKALEGATRALGDSDLPVESSDLRVMSPVIHYAEALFARYDVNRTSELETPEVWSVYPLIRPFIQKLAVDSDGKPINLNAGYEKAIFSWLLEVGEAPTTSILGKIELWAHRWTMWTVREHAGFRDIIGILANFQKVGRVKKNTDVAKFYMSSSRAWELGIGRNDKAIMDKTRNLMQCAIEAEADLLRLLQARRADIFAVDSKADQQAQAVAFTNRLKSMVQADPQLQVLCMAF